MMVTRVPATTVLDRPMAGVDRRARLETRNVACTWTAIAEKSSLLSGYKSNRFNWLQISPKSLSQPIS
jgi:hypothetical protein